MRWGVVQTIRWSTPMGLTSDDDDDDDDDMMMMMMMMRVAFDLALLAG